MSELADKRPLPALQGGYSPFDVLFNDPIAIKII
jgi:hypothetical protein